MIIRLWLDDALVFPSPSGGCRCLIRPDQTTQNGLFISKADDLPVDLLLRFKAELMLGVFCMFVARRENAYRLVAGRTIDVRNHLILVAVYYCGSIRQRS